MRMDLDGGDFGGGMSIGHGERLAARGSTAVEYAGACLLRASNQHGDELGGFVLNDEFAAAKGFCICNISGLSAAGGGQELTWLQTDGFALQIGFGSAGSQTEGGLGYRLIVAADLKSGWEAVLGDPAFDEPERMRQVASQSLRGSGFGWGVRGAGEFSENGIYEWDGGTLAGALDEFHAFVEGGAFRDASEPAELIEREAKCDENFWIEFG